MYHAACTASWLLLILHVSVGHAVTHTHTGAEPWKTAPAVLEAAVVSKVYNDKNYKDDKIKARILSPEWWAKVAVVSKAVSGIISLIRMGDSNKPTLGMLYYPAVIAIEEHLEGMLGRLSSLSANIVTTAHNIVTPLAGPQVTVTFHSRLACFKFGASTRCTSSLIWQCQRT
jgi:hypothetical protein